MALRARKVSGAFEKRAPGRSRSRTSPWRESASWSRVTAGPAKNRVALL